MAVLIHRDLVYNRTIQELPQSYRKMTESLTPVSGQQFSAGTFTDFYLPTNFFLKQTLNLKANYLLASAVGTEICGTPAYTVINRIQITCGSLVILSLSIM